MIYVFRIFDSFYIVVIILLAFDAAINYEIVGLLDIDI